jgi:CRISPR-associated protein Cas2
MKNTGKEWFLVCYDIREPRRLRKVAKLLEGYGERMQYSVFRCRLTEKEKARMLWELGKIINEEDALMLVPVCRACIARMNVKRQHIVWDTEPELYRVV